MNTKVWPFLGLLVPGRALAVDAHGFLFMGTSGSPSAYTRIGEATAGPSGEWSAGVVMDYAAAPLTETYPWGREATIDGLGTANIAGSYSFGGLAVDVVLPVHLVGVDDTGTWSAMGDAHLGVLVPAWEEHGWRPAVALSVMTFLPTGNAEHFVGGEGPHLGGTLTASEEFGRVGVIAMLGAQVGFAEEERNLSGGIGPMLGIGAAYRVSDALSVTYETTAQSDLSALPVEMTVSGRYRLPAGAWATAGVAGGVGGAVGASRWRTVAGVGWSYREPEPVEGPIYALPPEDPTADRDGDGIPDMQDQCKDQAETVDGFDDADGCPELDGDADGVSFAVDQCPREAIRPEQDPRWSDGCPKVAEFSGDRIVITETIFFTEGRAELLPSTVRVLSAVRDVMLAHPEIEYFLVEGHTNNNGSDVYNLRLSDARAFAVASWLGANGIVPSRLLSKGFGESRPLVPEDSVDAPAINRRVEFKVVQVEQIPADARRIELPEEVR